MQISQCLPGYTNFHISNLLWNMKSKYSSIINQNQLPLHWAGSHTQGLKTCCCYSCLTLQGRHIYKFMKPHPFLYRQGLSVDFTWKEHKSNKKRRNEVLPFHFWGHLDNLKEKNPLWEEKWLQSGLGKQRGPSHCVYLESRMEQLHVFSFLIFSLTCWIII